MRWAGHVTRIGEKKNACGLLVGKSEGKRTLGRPRRRWVQVEEDEMGGACNTNRREEERV
jgi:hypothetical protein